MKFISPRRKILQRFVLRRSYKGENASRSDQYTKSRQSKRLTIPT